MSTVIQVTPTSISKLLQLTHKMQVRGVRYGLGAKAPGLDCDSSEIERIDCSGFVRYVLHKCGGPDVPDGSVNIHEWAKEAGLQEVPYRRVSEEPGQLYLCFITPEGSGEGIGHVFLVWMTLTCESHGGKGVDRRTWHTPVLLRETSACYILPHSA